MARKRLIALHPAMEAELVAIAKAECRTFSELMREAARRYIHEFKLKHLSPGSTFASDAVQEIADAAAAFSRGE